MWLQYQYLHYKDNQATLKVTDLLTAEKFLYVLSSIYGFAFAVINHSPNNNI